MSVNWQNPYEQRRGRWLRGNLHAHATPLSPCASVPIADLGAAYAQRGLDFLSVSEHMAASAPACDGLVMLPGLEWNSRSRYMANRSLTYQHHLGVYSLDVDTLEAAVLCRDPHELCAGFASQQTLLVANHPNWLLPEHYDHYTLHLLAEGLDGLEIYNAQMEWDEGEADATGRWDRLLSTGRPLLGFAGDDAHAAAEAGQAWLAARVDGDGPEAVFQALKHGNFYCSTGVELADIGREGDELFVRMEREARIRVIGRLGRLLAERVAGELRWALPEGEDYARFQIMDRDWAQAWSQPFFRRAGGAS